MPNQPRGDGLTIGTVAVTNEAAMAVTLDKRALRRTGLGQEIGECVCGDFAASIAFALRIPAGLTAFRRVDTVEADTLTMDLDCVAVHDRGAANNRVRQCCRQVRQLQKHRNGSE